MTTLTINPCPKATKRVKDALPVPKECNCCGSVEVALVANKEIYGRNYGEWPYAYLCRSCGAYVGLHLGTNIPLGTLADEATRQARKECKAPFEALHKTGKMSRDEAYQRLADKLGIPKDECHFGWFDVEQCHKAAAAAREIFLGV